MYSIIHDYLLTLLPSTLTPQLTAWLDLATLATLTFLYVTLLMLVVWVFRLFGGLFKW